MNPKDAFYNGVVDDLLTSGLEQDQIENAILPRVASVNRDNVKKLIATRYAQFLTENQLAVPATEFDMNQGDSAYAAHLKSKNSERLIEEEEETEVNTHDLDRYSEGLGQVVNLITETANLADKRGLIKQANQLDEILKNLI